MSAVGRLFKRRLIAGLVVIAPLGVTAWVLWWLFRLLDGILGDLLESLLAMRIPGLGLVVLVLLLLGVGWLAEVAIGARILGWWHAALDRVPLVSRVYGAIRRIVGSVFGGQEQRFFREVVFFEYPTRGEWTLGFVTGGIPPALQHRIDGGVTVFLPTSPNPVTGFLIVVPEDRLVRVPMSVEEGFTFILSAGAVAPATMSRDTPSPASPASPAPDSDSGPTASGPGSAGPTPAPPRGSPP